MKEITVREAYGISDGRVRSHAETAHSVMDNRGDDSDVEVVAHGAILVVVERPNGRVRDVRRKKAGGITYLRPKGSFLVSAIFL